MFTGAHRAAGAAAVTIGLVTGCMSSGTPGATPSRTSVTAATHTAPTRTGPVFTRPHLGKMCGWAPVAPLRYQHVIWIWFENHSYGKIVGSPSAPYLNNTVATNCALATNFHNTSHPSLPNYLGATSGRTDGVTRDCNPNTCSSTSTSIFHQLEQAGKTWKGYAESMPRNCAHFDTPPYAARHNPPVYYIDIKSTCPVNDVPMGTTSGGAFAQDLNRDTLPSFAFVTPNLCSDMHSCSVSTGDTWLKGWLTKIVNSPAYNSGTTAVFVSWDEGGGGTHGEDCASPSNTDQSCHIATYVLGPAVRPGAQVSTRFTQYSMLRTTESMLGLTTYLGNAATAAGMRQAFRL